MKVYDTICVSGGGIKGFAFIGALEYLHNKLFLDLKFYCRIFRGKFFLKYSTIKILLGLTRSCF